MTTLPNDIFSRLGEDGKKDQARVLEVTRRILSAAPISIRPEVRSTLIEQLLDELDPNQSEAAGHEWKDGVVCSVLEAVKVLGRNPVGSEPLVSSKYLAIVARHAHLASASFSSSGNDSDRPGPSSHHPLTTSSPSQKQAISIIANTLRLFDRAVDVCVDLNIGRQATEALRRHSNLDCTLSDDLKQTLQLPSEHDETLKLVSGNGRRSSQGGGIVDEEMIFLLGRVLMLMTANRPHQKTSFAVTFVEELDGVQVLVKTLGTLPLQQTSFAALVELLNTAYHALVLLPDQGAKGWAGRLEILLPALLDLLFRLPINDLFPPLTSTLNCLSRIPVNDTLRPIWTAATLERPSSPSSPSRRRRSMMDLLRPSVKPTMQSLTQRVISTISNYLTQLPGGLSWRPDEGDSLNVDEVLPSALLLLTNLANAGEGLRREIKDLLISEDLDRSPASVPLEKRSTVLGVLLRLLSSSQYGVTGLTLGELFWTICNGDAAALSREIGYGNAAGLLFAKGMSAPPEPSAHVEEISEAQKPQQDRNIITGLKDDPLAPSALPEDEMTEEEKMREAEKIMSYFDRMEKNPAMKIVENPMRQALNDGRTEAWDEANTKKMLEAEEAEEAEALRELAAYKARRKL